MFFFLQPAAVARPGLLYPPRPTERERLDGRKPNRLRDWKAIRLSQGGVTAPDHPSDWPRPEITSLEALSPQAVTPGKLQ